MPFAADPYKLLCRIPAAAPTVPDKTVCQAPAAVPMVPDRAVCQAPAAVPMVPDRAVCQAPAVVPLAQDRAVCQAPAVVPLAQDRAVCRMADNSDYNYMPSDFPPADRLLIIDYAFIHLSCIINEKSISGPDSGS